MICVLSQIMCSVALQFLCKFETSEEANLLRNWESGSTTAAWTCGCSRHCVNFFPQWVLVLFIVFDVWVGSIASSTVSCLSTIYLCVFCVYEFYVRFSNTISFLVNNFAWFCLNACEIKWQQRFGETTFSTNEEPIYFLFFYSLSIVYWNFQFYFHFASQLGKITMFLLLCKY